MLHYFFFNKLQYIIFSDIEQNPPPLHYFYHLILQQVTSEENAFLSLKFYFKNKDKICVDCLIWIVVQYVTFIIFPSTQKRINL